MVADSDPRDFDPSDSNRSEFDRYLDDYDFDLPPDLIASRPPSLRGESRLLGLDITNQKWIDYRFEDLPRLLSPGDTLILNNTRVSKRRLLLRRENGATLPALFLEPTADGCWACLIRGSGRLKKGELLRLPGSEATTGLIYRGRENPSADSIYTNSPVSYLEFASLDSDSPRPLRLSAVEAEPFFESHGMVPLPDYLKRKAEPEDADRYQTIYARGSGSVAAPTAGLHFSRELLAALREKDIDIAELELVVGYGTFAPLRESNFARGRLHREIYSLSAQCARQLNSSRGRRIAVGTTTLRALESNFREAGGEFRSGSFETTLFIRPPDSIQSAAGLITNFHLPKSSLFLLVCAFAGREFLQRAYRHAVFERYRFYSYGDAMLILQPGG